jgi:hypothetical protein
MAYVAPPVEWVLLGVTLGYLGTVAAVMLYFEKQHPQTWALIGYPSFGGSPTVLRIGNWLPLMAILLGLGFLFRQSWKLPNDSMLTLLLWTARILGVTALAFRFLLSD